MNERMESLGLSRLQTEVAATGERATVRCAIYGRSATTPRMHPGLRSPRAQRLACERYIALRAGDGWQVLATRYCDRGYAGSSLERPALQRLLDACEDGRVDVVVVASVDRLTRSNVDLARLVNRFAKAGVKLISVKENVSAVDEGGPLALALVLGFAEVERERRERTRHGS